MGGTCAPLRALGGKGVESGPVMSDFAGERNVLRFLLSFPDDSTLIVWFPYTIPGPSLFFFPLPPREVIHTTSGASQAAQIPRWVQYSVL